MCQLHTDGLYFHTSLKLWAAGDIQAVLNCLKPDIKKPVSKKLQICSLKNNKQINEKHIYRKPNIPSNHSIQLFMPAFAYKFTDWKSKRFLIPQNLPKSSFKHLPAWKRLPHGPSWTDRSSCCRSWRRHHPPASARHQGPRPVPHSSHW